MLLNLTEISEIHDALGPYMSQYSLYFSVFIVCTCRYVKPMMTNSMIVIMIIIVRGDTFQLSIFQYTI